MKLPGQRSSRGGTAQAGGPRDPTGLLTGSGPPRAATTCSPRAGDPEGTRRRVHYGPVPSLLLQPHRDRLGDLLNHRLQDRVWTTFRAAVAFVKRSGVDRIAASLGAFARRGHVRMTLGIDVHGTSVEGLESLLNCLGGQGEIRVFHNEHGPTFHPKMYVFSNDRNAEVIIGSGNLTQGGLYENYEASIALTLDLTDGDDHALFTSLEAILDAYTDLAPRTAVELTHETLERLRADRYIVPEAEMRRPAPPPAAGVPEYGVPPADPLFRHVPVPPAPPASVVARGGPTPRGGDEAPAAFYMTLQHTDVGTGQTTPGTARRSPEVFIPLAARNAASEFWGWPEAFTEDPQEPGKMDRTGVPMAVDNSVVGVSMTYFPHRHEFRVRHERLRSAGAVGDILRIERTDDATEHDYSVTVIRQGGHGYDGALSRCTNAVGGRSQKRWGYE